MAVAHSRAGSGEPLVLVHGLGGSRRIWAPVIDRLEAEREVIAVDLPGFGESAPLADGTPPTAANLAGAVDELVGELGLERPHLAGNSLGGWVALELAKARAGADRVRDLAGRPLAPAARPGEVGLAVPRRAPAPAAAPGDGLGPGPRRGAAQASSRGPSA